MEELVSLCKRRGFIFQSNDIYGGVKGLYDYGPMGVELKNNLKQSWWKSMIYERDDVEGLDATILTGPDVLKHSGHEDTFSDPLVDCKSCKSRWKADQLDNQSCPNCKSKDLTDPRPFNLMFKTSIGPVDDGSSFAYLRPETAQQIFTNFKNVLDSTNRTLPFGIAQIGKAFRNEITPRNFIFRVREFEQMEMEFFVEPGTQKEWLDYWRDRRMEWWQSFANDPSKFRYRTHEKDELAHYAEACYDIEYEYPWGFDELEGVASRTDYDLKKHAEHSGAKLSYFDQQKQDPDTGKNGWRYTPYGIEPAAGVTRGLLVYLLDAYHEETVPNADGEDSTRVVMKLHPRLAPIKVAVLPLVKKEGLPEIAREMVSGFFKAGINARYDEQHSIGKRYRRHDEAGTPYCITIDGQTTEDGTVTIRDRDTMEQERISKDEALQVVQKRLIES